MPHKSKHKQQFRQKTIIAAPQTSREQIVPPGPTTEVAVTNITKATVAAPLKVATKQPKTQGNPLLAAAIGPARYPFLASEIKWIGIFALIIIVLLIIAKIVVPQFVG
jgi:hypothetical protein